MHLGPLHLCMFVGIYACMYTYVYACLDGCVYVYVCSRNPRAVQDAPLSTQSMYVCIWLRVGLCACVCMLVCVCIMLTYVVNTKTTASLQSCKMPFSPFHVHTVVRVYGYMR